MLSGMGADIDDLIVVISLLPFNVNFLMLMHSLLQEEEREKRNIEAVQNEVLTYIKYVYIIYY